ncbi:MAG TPA: YtxH domain-containing protein [Clostridia bacterium]|nr:YtxH domain-containing protein [Clostridia bacterium]
MADYKTFGDYEYSEKNDAGRVILFLAIGIGVGALAGLLMAPKTGRQMRRTLRRKYEDARERIGNWGEQAGDVMERGSEWASTAKERVAPFARKMRRS